MEKVYKLLVFSFGGTSIKAGVFEDGRLISKTSIRYTKEEMMEGGSYWNRKEPSRKAILDFVSENGLELEDFDAIVSRGGNAHPVASGVYEVSAQMIADAKDDSVKTGFNDVGLVLAYELAQAIGKPVFTVDPPDNTEMMKIARYSGHPEIWRQGGFHVLNQKATARFLARDLGKKYEEMRAIVVHLGSGITVGAHCLGQVLDVNNGLNGDGPFAPERAGTLPVGDLIKLCYSGKYTLKEMLRQVQGNAGLAAYLGTTDGREIEARIENGDQFAEEVVEAMCYQIAEEIGARAVTLEGKVDGIALTGGLAYWERIPQLIKKRVGWIAPVHVYPGEDELESLSAGAMRYLKGEEDLKEYK